MILGVGSIGGLHVDFVWSLVGHIIREDAGQALSLCQLFLYKTSPSWNMELMNSVYIPERRRSPARHNRRS